MGNIRVPPPHRVSIGDVSEQRRPNRWRITQCKGYTGHEAVGGTETTVGDRVAVYKQVEANQKLPSCQVGKPPVSTAKSRRIILRLQINSVSLHKIYNSTCPRDIPQPLEKEPSPRRDITLILAAKWGFIIHAPSSIQIIIQYPAVFNTHCSIRRGSVIREHEESTGVEHHTDDVFVGDIGGDTRCDSTADRNKTAHDDESEDERPLLR